MADEQTTQTTQEQGGAQTAGGRVSPSSDPNVSTPEPGTMYQITTMPQAWEHTRRQSWRRWKHASQRLKEGT